jgi:hypothetical protein
MSFGEEPIRNPPVLDPALGPPHAAITCPTCGYDLRGDLARGFCSECATPKRVALERAAEGAWGRLVRIGPSLAARVALSLVLCGTAFVIVGALLGGLESASEEIWTVALAIGMLAAILTALFELAHALVRRWQVALTLFAAALAAWVGFLLHLARDPGELAEIPLVVAITSAILGTISAGLHHLSIRRQVQLAIGLAILLPLVVAVVALV